MKRLYYLTKSITSAEEVSEDLHRHGISDWRFHIISRDEAGLFTHKLHSANILHKTDIVRFLERGIMLGALIGLALVIPATQLSVAPLPASLLLAMVLFCMLSGAWIGCVGGISCENYKIQRFHNAIEKGQYLLMIDLKVEDVENMKALMANHHPEVSLQLLDSTITNPFLSADGKIHVL